MHNQAIQFPFRNRPRRQTYRVRRPALGLALLGLLLALAACAPAGTTSRFTATTQTGQVALAAFHRMELAQVETGSYTTNALIDLEIPQGVRWTVDEFTESSYRLRVENLNQPDEVYIVTPAGVQPVGSGGRL